MLAILGALLVTGVAGYAIFGALGLWWFVLAGGMEWSPGAFAYCTFWSVVAGVIGFVWWLLVGSHITIGLS